jgi:hypothetical protein
VALGAAAYRSEPLASPEALPAYLAGLALAAGSSLVGFALLRRGLAVGSHAFVALLLGLFLGRVALVGVFGLALYALAPAHLASGLLSLVGYHFVFALVEVALLARSGAAGLGVRRKTRATGSG